MYFGFISMKKILEFFGTKVFKQVGDVIDNLFTSDEERIKAKNEIFKVLQEKELELQKQKVIGFKEVGDQFLCYHLGLLLFILSLYLSYHHTW